MSQINENSELVLGIVTTVGTNTDGLISCIEDELAKFHYTTEVINISKEVLSPFGDNSFGNSEYDRIKYFMDLGNRVRTTANDSSILMKGAAATIFKKRDPSNLSPKSRVAYIIKSIKHPEEVSFLRSTYGVGFHLIGITSSFERRYNYLTERKSLTKEQAQELLARDENEANDYGQHTRDAFQQSDYFINLENETDKMQASVERLIDLLFGNPFISPTFYEYAMFIAYATSLRSADLSRQIGAVITRNNEILSEGTNDCPKTFGGLYWPELNQNGKIADIPNGRDYTLMYGTDKFGYDSNKIEQRKIINRIIENLNLENTKDNIKAIKRAGIGSLTEYGRVVHAEMEAILMCARNNISCKGGIMYVTTFPCHNCAKHIIASGIREVVYIEPYPKSKALEFYQNEITQNYTEKGSKVWFHPFVGVGPHRFMELFSMSSIQNYSKIRKNDDGFKVNFDRNEANLRSPLPIFNYIESEQGAYSYYCEAIAKFKEEK